jgi:hypothetical protein
MLRCLTIIFALLLSCPSLAAKRVAPDSCSSIDPSLKWSSIQAALFPKEQTLSNEQSLFDRFDQIIASTRGSSPALLRLAQDMQTTIQVSRRPSRALERRWISLLLATEQSDIAYKVLTRPGTKKTSPLDSFLLAESLFMQKKYRDADTEYKKILSSDPRLQYYLTWRLSELELLFSSPSDSWAKFVKVIDKAPKKLGSDLKDALELDLIKFGQSRLDPVSYWAKIPMALDQERIAVCILNSKQAQASAKQSAYQKLAQLPVTTDRSVEFFRQSLVKLEQAHAARQSYISIIKAGLQTVMAHADKKSLARQTFLVDLQKTTQNLLAAAHKPDQTATNKQLVDALSGFTANGSPTETLLFRQQKATLQEILGNWSEAAEEYQKLLALSPDRSERGKLAWSMLKATRKATAPINDGDATLTANELDRAQGLLKACNIFNGYWPHAETERRDCENFSIRLSINQKNETLAKQQLWLYIAHYPEHSTEAIYSLFTLFRDDNAALIAGCEKLLRLPELQTGDVANFLRERLRQSRFEEIAKLKSPSDQAAAYASFAERERPNPLALQAISRAIAIDSPWQTKSNYLTIYIEKFPHGPELMESYLALAELYEANFALREAYALLKSAKQLPWPQDQIDRRNGLECRINRVEHPMEAVTSCLAVANANRRAPIDLAKRLLWAKESVGLHRLATSETVTGLGFTLNERIELLGIAFEGTSTVPALQNDIKNILYELYAENPDNLTGDSRRILAAIAFEVAQRALPLFLNMPIYAAQSSELAAAIQSKRAAFSDLEALYGKVLKTKDPYWGASALADLAVASSNLSLTLKEIGPVEGLDPKALEGQLTAPVGQWAARSKSFATASEKTLERFGILHENARRLKLDMQTLRGEQVLFTDALPEWEVPRAF